MAVQQTRKSRAKRDMRRAHDALTARTTSVDQVSGETHLRHHMTAGGFYRGRQIIKVAVEVEDEEQDQA